MMKSHNFFLTLVMGLSLSIYNCSGKADSSLGEKLIQVRAQQVKACDGSESLAYSGTIEESESVSHSFSSLGTVSRVYVAEGDAVRKGQLLAEINDATYRNTYQMTRATEEQAEDGYKRLTPMHQNGNLSDVKYVEVEIGLRQARAAAAIARKNLDDCKLVATTSGYVGRRSIEPGMTATPGLASITIVKIARVFARVSVSESEIAQVKKGDQASIRIGALGGREYPGTVEEIGVMADLLTHSYKIKISVANADGLIKPGMVCSVLLRHAAETRSVVVPGHVVLVDENGRNFIYRVDAAQKQAMRVYVKTGKLVQDGIEITNGLQVGDWIVTAGQHKLVDHSPVTIIGQ